jgi:hypothetical protein
MFCRISKHFSFADGGLSDYLPGPIKDLDQTGPLTAGKTRKHFASRSYLFISTNKYKCFT